LYQYIFTVPVLHPCHSCWDRSDPMHPSRRPFWQHACPFLASWDHFRPCEVPAPTGAGCCIIAAQLVCRSHWDAAMGPRLCYPLHDPCGGLHAKYQPRGTVLAALRHSQNQQKRCESGEMFQVSAWYRLVLMGPALCARLGDPSDSLHAHFCLGGPLSAMPGPCSDRCGCSACRSSWDDAMGPRLSVPL
jgi:hypothetical protein